MGKQNLYVEDYRPRKIEDCVLPPRMKSLFQDVVDRGEIPNMIFEGAPGCGKTTVAKAIAAELGVDTIVINGSDERNIDTLRTKVKSHATVAGSGVGSMLDEDSPRSRQRLVIFDEADYLNCFSGEQTVRAVNDDGSFYDVALKDAEGETIRCLSFDFGSGRLIETFGDVLVSGEAEVFEVEFEDGTKMFCTEDHPFFTEDGDETNILEGKELSSV